MNKLLQTRKKIDYNYSYFEEETEKKNSKLMISLLVFLVVIIGIIMLVFIKQSLEITHLGYDLDKIGNQLDEINEKNHELNLKLARYSSLARIEKIARNNLNMLEPEEMQVIVMNDSNITDELSNRNLAKNERIYILRLFNELISNFRTVKADSPD